MKVIIIDDEQKGRESLQKLLEIYCIGVEVVAMASDITEANDLIRLHKPHVVFLDIEMPGGDGFSLLDKFPGRDFEVIMTTAFEDYAIRAVKHHAFDYLLKPIDMDELVFAVDTAKRTLGRHAPEQAKESAPDHAVPQKLALNGRVALPVKDGIFYLVVSDIIRIESDGGYSTFYTVDGKKYLVAKNLKDYEDILPDKNFFRVHKSHLINIDKVKKYIRTDGNFLEMEGGSVVEIARRKKEEFLQLMNAIG
jgi:two-component system, LytTR family, response regulator